MRPLTKAEKRILSNVLNGMNPFVGGGNGPTRQVIRNLNRDGLLSGHVLTDAGRAALTRATT